MSSLQEPRFASPAPHPLRRATDWPSCGPRPGGPVAPARRPGRRASDRVLRAAPVVRPLTGRRRIAPRRRRRSRSTGNRSGARRHSSGSGAADGPPAADPPLPPLSPPPRRPRGEASPRARFRPPPARPRAVTADRSRPPLPREVTS
ncbi:hypothetical protein Shyd_62730 [Streptomyces hydrogenans]|uniref:Uncharacterized protein n=1 Tax=Streptomyces hydrogenans TaxID=1873719 RepID=A0ABQ3PIR1_9ACTN|nr:hypothetical protein Shyd_62730 [Streptomyces hydrogenans]